MRPALDAGTAGRGLPGQLNRSQYPGVWDSADRPRAVLVVAAVIDGADRDGAAAYRGQSHQKRDQQVARIIALVPPPPWSSKKSPASEDGAEFHLHHCATACSAD